MKNLKIRVESEAESKEAQELFFELGYKWFSGGNQVQHLKQSCSSSFGYLVAWSNGCFTNVIQCGCGNEDAKEITLPQLRDLVVLKRNNRKDANVSEENCLHDLYLTESRELYFYHCGKNKWILSNLNGDDDYYESLKPIEKKEMKQQEYLVENADGEYFLTTSSNYPDGIKVPEGAEEYRGNSLFYKNNGKEFFNGENWNTSTYGDFSVLWQRDNRKEPLNISFDLGVEGGDETKINTIENPLFPDFVLSEPVVKNNDFNGLDKSEINHRVAKAFNVIRGTDLNEDDMHFIRQLIDSVTFHYWDRK